MTYLFYSCELYLSIYFRSTIYDMILRCWSHAHLKAEIGRSGWQVREDYLGWGTDLLGGNGTGWPFSSEGRAMRHEKSSEASIKHTIMHTFLVLKLFYLSV